MRDCGRLKNISPNIFRLTNLEKVDFANCGDVITVLSDVGRRIIYPVSWIDIFLTHSHKYLNFANCFKLDEDAREFILRSCFKRTVLSGGEVPTYFKHRAFGNSLTVTSPQSVLSQDILQFKACIVFEAPFKCPRGLDLNGRYILNGMFCKRLFLYRFSMFSCETDHLVLCSFEFEPEDLPSKLEFNNVEFTFGSTKKIKGCGVRLLNVSLSPDGSDKSYETTYNQQSADKCDVVETGGSKKRMRMASGTS